MKANTAVIHSTLQGAVLAALAALCLPSAAAETESVPYVGIHLGANNLSRWPGSVNFGGGVHVNGVVSLDGDTQAGLILGRQTEKARFELEIQHGRFKLTGLNLGPVSEPATGRGHYDALTLNAYRTQELNQDWTGFVGAGVGWGSAKLPQAGFSNGCNCFGKASKSGLAYQARVGAEYLWGEGHKAFLQYNWLSLPGPASDGIPGVSYSRHGVGSIALGYRKAF